VGPSQRVSTPTLSVFTVYRIQNTAAGELNSWRHRVLTLLRPRAALPSKARSKFDTTQTPYLCSPQKPPENNQKNATSPMSASDLHLTWPPIRIRLLLPMFPVGGLDSSWLGLIRPDFIERLLHLLLRCSSARIYVLPQPTSEISPWPGALGERATFCLV
jgi:hypothetical protein